MHRFVGTKTDKRDWRPRDQNHGGPGTVHIFSVQLSTLLVHNPIFRLPRTCLFKQHANSFSNFKVLPLGELDLRTYLIFADVVFRCRSVPYNRRAFALGTQMIIWRLLGNILKTQLAVESTNCCNCWSFTGAIPGPIIFGLFIDGSCVLWTQSNDDCGSNSDNSGSCLVYDNYSFSRYSLSPVFFSNLLITSFSVDLERWLALLSSVRA